MSTVSPEYAALRGNRPQELNREIGLEIVSRATRVALLKNLEFELSVQEDLWGQSDREIQALGLDVGIGEVTLEVPTPANIHQGPHKSLLAAGADDLPYLAVGAHAAIPGGDNTFDQFSTTAITLSIEVYVKSDQVFDGTETQNETILDRRINRTVEAVAAAMKASQNLYATVKPIQAPPRVVLFDQTWITGLDTGGPRYLQQGARLQYTLERNSAL